MKRFKALIPAILMYSTVFVLQSAHAITAQTINGSWSFTVDERPFQTSCKQEIVDAIGAVGNETAKIKVIGSSLSGRYGDGTAVKGRMTRNGFVLIDRFAEGNVAVDLSVSVAGISNKIASRSSLRYSIFYKNSYLCDLRYNVKARKQ